MFSFTHRVVGPYRIQTSPKRVVFWEQGRGGGYLSILRGVPYTRPIARTEFFLWYMSPKGSCTYLLNIMFWHVQYYLWVTLNWKNCRYRVELFKINWLVSITIICMLLSKSWILRVWLNTYRMQGTYGFIKK